MKAILLSITVLIFFSFISNLRSEEVTIPAANFNHGTSPFPLTANFGYTRSECLYMASEIGTYGMISEIAFYLNNAFGPLADSIPVVIRMKTSTNTNFFPGVTYDSEIAGSVIVYQGMIHSYDITLPWTSIQLDVPFNFNQHNLLVFIETNYGNTGGEPDNAKGFRMASSNALDAGAPPKLRTWTSNFAPPVTLSQWSGVRPNMKLKIYSFEDCKIVPLSVKIPEDLNFSCGIDEYVTPETDILNLSTIPQYDVTVSLEISGPVSYSSQKIIDTIEVSEGKDVFFDDFNIKTPGIYSAKVRTSFQCKGGPEFTDSVESSFEIIRPDFGGGEPVNDLYFFANSTPCGMNASSYPEVTWEDTTGGKSLIVNGEDVSGGLLSGTTDEGFFSLGNILSPGDKFKYCGVDYDSFFVGTNGQIGFVVNDNNYNGLVEYSASLLPYPTPAPAIFPLWNDMNFGHKIMTQNRLSYKVDGNNNRLIITYDRAPRYDSKDSAEYISFQVILETAPGPSENGNIIIQYNAEKTGATWLANYNNYHLGIGMQNHLATSFIQYRFTEFFQVAYGPIFSTARANGASSSMALAFGTNSQVLPVELSSFTFSVSENNVTLNWTTSAEINNSGFEIERAPAADPGWTAVGRVEGIGTSGDPHSYSFTDRNISKGKYKYRLKQSDYNGNFEYYSLSGEVSIGQPSKFDMSQNYPNPFNPETKISYDLPVDGKINLKIYDISGREVKTLVNEVQTAGYYTINFNGSELSSGVYFYRISLSSEGNDFVMTKKMMLIK